MPIFLLGIPIAKAGVALLSAAKMASVRAGGLLVRHVILNPKAHVGGGAQALASGAGTLIAADGTDPRDWNFENLDYGALVIDYSLGTGGTGIILQATRGLPAAARQLVNGAGTGRLAAARVIGTGLGDVASVMAVSGVVRSMTFGTDCSAQLNTDIPQASLILLRRTMSDALFHGSIAGTATENLIVVGQTIAFRHAWETNPGLTQDSATRTCAVPVTDQMGRFVSFGSTPTAPTGGEEYRVHLRDESNLYSWSNPDGWRRDCIRLQRWLSERGFYDGKIDGCVASPGAFDASTDQRSQTWFHHDAPRSDVRPELMGGERLHNNGFTDATVVALNEYAQATGFRVSDAERLVWTATTTRAYLRLLLSGELDPRDGEAPLTQQEREIRFDVAPRISRELVATL